MCCLIIFLRVASECLWYFCNAFIQVWKCCNNRYLSNSTVQWCAIYCHHVNRLINCVCYKLIIWCTRVATSSIGKAKERGDSLNIREPQRCPAKCTGSNSKSWRSWMARWVCIFRDKFLNHVTKWTGCWFVISNASYMSSSKFTKWGHVRFDLEVCHSCAASTCAPPTLRPFTVVVNQMSRSAFLTRNSICEMLTHSQISIRCH